MTALIAGNLLTVEQQSSDTVAGWSAKGTNTTLARVTDLFFDSPASVRLTAVAAGTVQASTGYTAVNDLTPGMVVAFRMRSRADLAARSVKALINWADAGNNLLSQGSYSLGNEGAVGQWVELSSASITIPDLAVQAEIIVIWSGCVEGEVHHFDARYFGAAANALPTVTVAASATSVTVGATVTLTATATDPDGTVASYSWGALGRPAGSTATLSGSGATRTFVADVAGDYPTPQVTVTDNAGGVSAPASAGTVTASPPPATGDELYVLTAAGLVPSRKRVLLAGGLTA